MDSSRLIRGLALSAAVGGALWSVAFLSHAAKPRGCVAKECDTRSMRESGVLDAILMVASSALIVAGVVGLVLVARRSGRMGALGTGGLVLGGAGATVLVVGALVQALLYDGDFVHMPYFVVPGLAALILGFVLLGFSILRAGVLPMWRTLLLVGGALVMIGANEQTVLALLFVPFGLAWIVVGHGIWLAASNTPDTPTSRGTAVAG